MGFWWSAHAKFEFRFADWHDIGNKATLKLTEIASVPFEGFQYAEDGVRLGVEFNSYDEKAVVSFDLRTEGSYDYDINYWFLLACEKSQPDHAVFRAIDDWDGDRVDHWPIGPDDFDWSENIRWMHDLNTKTRSDSEEDEVVG